MSTGLPELPKGQFWRVRRDGESYLALELRAKHMFGTGSRLIQSATIRTWGFSSKPEGTRDYTQDELRVQIRKAAEEMLRKRAEKDILNSSLNELTGDYPPKRLEA